jgi:hypothetical protein
MVCWPGLAVGRPAPLLPHAPLGLADPDSRTTLPCVQLPRQIRIRHVHVTEADLPVLSQANLLETRFWPMSRTLKRAGRFPQVYLLQCDI